MRVNPLLRSAGPVLSVAIVWSCGTLSLSAQTTTTAPAQPTTAASSASCISATRIPWPLAACLMQAVMASCWRRWMALKRLMHQRWQRAC